MPIKGKIGKGEGLLSNYLGKISMVIGVIVLLPITIPIISVIYMLVWLYSWKHDKNVQRDGVYGLPIHPIKVYKRAKALLLGVLDGLGGPTIPIFFAFFKRRLMSRKIVSDTSISGIQYGPLPRHKMELFVPLGLKKGKEERNSSEKGADQDASKDYPVIIVFPGYSWNNTGLVQFYKPMSQTLCEMGVFVILPSLGLPGKTSLSEILEDMQLVVQWTIENIGKSGGDPNQIHLFGFGAGAHMCAMYNIASALAGWKDKAPFSQQTMTRLLSNTNSSAELGEWLRRLKQPVFPVAGLILVSGVYSLEKQRKYETMRCIETLSMCSRLFDSQDFAEAWSPLNILVSLRKHGIFIPNNCFARRVLLVHGQKDSTFPLELSQLLFKEYCLMDMDDVNMKVYANLRRIDPSVILSVPDSSLAKSFLDDIKAAIFVDEYEFEDGDDSSPVSPNGSATDVTELNSLAANTNDSSSDLLSKPGLEIDIGTEDLAL